MSRTASVTIELGRAVPPRELVSLLLEAGWTYDCYGSIHYLPLGDNDAFNWQIEPLDRWSEVWDTLERKERNAELIGLGLSWRDAGVGGSLLLRPAPELTMILDARRP